MFATLLLSSPYALYLCDRQLGASVIPPTVPLPSLQTPFYRFGTRTAQANEVLVLSVKFDSYMQRYTPCFRDRV